MKLKLRFGSVLICLTFLTGCSAGLLTELVAPVTNFGLGLYNADTYYSKECAWYEEIKLTPATKQWLTDSKPPAGVVKDLAKVARNNDIYKEVCDPKEPKKE